MARKFSELTANWPEDRKQRVRNGVENERDQMRLADLRQARDQTQKELAAALQIDQAAVSRIEQRADMYISTLARYLNALGAELRIQAVFPDRSVEIDQFTGALTSKE